MTYMKTIFESSATNEGGRNGHVTSEDGLIDLDVRMPGGKTLTEGKYSNPEQLFAAAYSTCFASALQAVAKEHKVKDLGDFNVTAIIALQEDEDGFLPTVDQEKGEELVNAAHEICPYSKATRDNITVHLNLLLDE